MILYRVGHAYYKVGNLHVIKGCPCISVHRVDHTHLCTRWIIATTSFSLVQECKATPKVIISSFPLNRSSAGVSELYKIHSLVDLVEHWWLGSWAGVSRPHFILLGSTAGVRVIYLILGGVSSEVTLHHLICIVSTAGLTWCLLVHSGANAGVTLHHPHTLGNRRG